MAGWIPPLSTRSPVWARAWLRRLHSENMHFANQRTITAPSLSSPLDPELNQCAHGPAYTIPEPRGPLSTTRMGYYGLLLCRSRSQSRVGRRKLAHKRGRIPGARPPPVNSIAIIGLMCAHDRAPVSRLGCCLWC